MTTTTAITTTYVTTVAVITATATVKMVVLVRYRIMEQDGDRIARLGLTAETVEHAGPLHLPLHLQPHHRPYFLLVFQDPIAVNLHMMVFATNLVGAGLMLVFVMHRLMLMIAVAPAVALLLDLHHQQAGMK
jgi:hypothetical protein